MLFMGLLTIHGNFYQFLIAMFNYQEGILQFLPFLPKRLGFFCLVGCRQEGTVEMRLTKIARRYLRTWFIFDLIIVGCSAGMAQNGLCRIHDRQIFYVF